MVKGITLLFLTARKEVCITNHIKVTEYLPKPHMIMLHPLLLELLLSRLYMDEIMHLVEDSEIMVELVLNPLKVRSLWEVLVALVCKIPLVAVRHIKARLSITANKAVSRAVEMT
jgi:hypothetical protein